MITFQKVMFEKNKKCFLIMISRCLELLLITITWLSYKLILRNVLWIALNLFFCTEEMLPWQLVQTASKDTSKGSSVAAPLWNATSLK